ncbi:MAG: alpha/beta fold hydrolase [Elstera sp.]
MPPPPVPTMPLSGFPPAQDRPPNPTDAGDGSNGFDPLRFTQAVEAAGRRRLGAFLTGVQRYRDHSYQRTLADPPELARWGTIRLLDYSQPGATGPVLLCLPSLINRAYILDLTEERSFLRWLASHGVRPLLMDWGTPGPDEADFTLTDYVEGAIFEALSLTSAHAGGRVNLLGYCMGGLLALAAAARHPALVERLLLLATPWDFHSDPAQVRRLTAALPALMQAIDWHGNLSIDLIQTLFAGIDPLQIARKFEAFSRLDPEGAPARAFVALEDWLNDGVPLVAPVARETLAGWYRDNHPPRGRWRVAGRPIRPSAITMPTLSLVPKADRIVPPASALALAHAIPGGITRDISLGHIGMMVGARAPALVWEPIRAFVMGEEA